MILAILPFAILGATIPGDGPADKEVSEQKEWSFFSKIFNKTFTGSRLYPVHGQEMIVEKNEANGFSTGTQPADISITKNLGSKHNTDVLSQGIRFFTEFHSWDYAHLKYH